MGGVNLRGAAGDINQFLGSVGADEGFKSILKYELESAHAAKLGIRSSEVGPTTLSGGTTNIGTHPITAGMFVLGVVIYVTTLITGCTSFKVGDGTDDDHWGATIALTAGTKTSSANFTAGPALFTGNTQIVLTAVGGGASFSAGAVRAAVFYVDVAALAS